MKLQERFSYILNTRMLSLLYLNHLKMPYDMHSFSVFSLFIFITLSSAQEIRTLKLFKIDNVRYQCFQSGCSILTFGYVYNLRRCQMYCLSHLQCRTVTYESSTHRCELFIHIPGQYGDLVAQIGVVTMTAVDERRLSARKWDGGLHSFY